MDSPRVQHDKALETLSYSDPFVLDDRMDFAERSPTSAPRACTRTHARGTANFANFRAVRP